MIPTQKSRRSQWQTLYEVTTGKKLLLLSVEQGTSGIGESTVIEPVILHLVASYKTNKAFRRLQALLESLTLQRLTRASERQYQQGQAK